MNWQHEITTDVINS